MMQIQNLTKRYGRKTVLNAVSLDFKEGNICGVVGENGAGKSTLFRCMVGLEDYVGTIVTRAEARIGYLPDTPYFYPLVTGREYLEFCLRAGNITYTDDDIDRLNLSFQLPLEDFPTSYSMGMRKRLVIMSMMLQKNDIYILDEPFNGLDLSGCMLLKRWLREMRDRQKTVILSSHIIPALTDICDSIAYIHKGSIAAIFTEMDAAKIENQINQNASICRRTS